MSNLSARETLEQVAQALPDDCRKYIIVVGSLAAAYHFFRRDPDRLVLTKDIDCMISPHVKAVQTGQVVAERLMAANWSPIASGPWTQPGDASTPTESLPMVRLHPPDSTEWNIELLNAPASPADQGRTFTRLETPFGHFALCSFGFLALAEEAPIETEFGLFIARPEMMALANMLHHPTIGAERMSGLIADRRIKRSNKDLSRVLALAFLAERDDEDALNKWSRLWASALRHRFPEHWRALSQRAGNGIRALLESNEDLDEASHCAANGLLASYRATRELLVATGQRLMHDAIQPLEAIRSS